MSETIIVAFLTGLVTVGVCLINNYFQDKRQNQKHDETVALIDYKLTELTKRVDKHEAIIDEKIKVINHRIDDLEEESK